MPAVLRLIPTAMSVSISSLRPSVPSLPSDPNLLDCLLHTTHKIRRAVQGGRKRRQGRGSDGVDRHLRPQAAASAGAAAAQELTPSARYRAAAAAPPRPLPLPPHPPAPASRRTATHSCPPSRSAERS